MKVLALAFISLLLGVTLHGADPVSPAPTPAPAPAPKVVEDPFAPARLTSLFIEKEDGATAITIQLKDDAVIYQVITGDKVIENVTVTPSGDDWFQFIQGLNNAKVYKWAPRYYYPGQGPGWAITLSMDDRKFGSSGTNEYPKEGSESEPAASPNAGPSIPFQIFWQAALQLVGKAPHATPPK